MASTYRNSRGFTLLEIMIALAILSGLALMTGQSITNAQKNRTKFSKQIKKDALVRDVLRVIERDVALAFHHRDFFIKLQNEAAKPATAAPPPPPPGFAVAPPVEPPPDPNQKPIPKNLTAFIGDAESIHFTTLANVRTYMDSPESEQAEVGYFVRPCKSRKPKPGKREVNSSQCLVRRLTPYVDDDVTKGGNEVILVENVEEFKLRYFGPEREDWVVVWKTGRDGDAISKENFPLAVEVTLTLRDQSDAKAKPVSMMLVAPVRFPNNPPKKQTNPDGTPANG